MVEEEESGRLVSITASLKHRSRMEKACACARSIIGLWRSRRVALNAHRGITCKRKRQWHARILAQRITRRARKREKKPMMALFFEKLPLA